MGVKSSGEISFTTDIVGEYGGTAPHSFSEYKRGGGEVPNITPNDAIPTTNSDISFSDFYGTTDRVAIALSIGSTTNNYNIWSNKTSNYVAHASDITLTISSNAVVGSSSTGTYALETGTGWQGTDTITIINNGWVIGRGGNGGNGGYGSTVNADNTAGSNGSAGGPAFRAQHAVTVTNNGNWYGGGGGGGGGGGSTSTSDGKLALTSSSGGGGGGGGAGYYASSGGTGGGVFESDDVFNQVGADGSAGTTTAGGAAGLYKAGAGGGPGQDGSNGDAASSGVGSYKAAGGSGGTRGYYQVGRSYINSGNGINTGNRGGRSS